MFPFFSPSLLIGWGRSIILIILRFGLNLVKGYDLEYEKDLPFLFSLLYEVKVHVHMSQYKEKRHFERLKIYYN